MKNFHHVELKVEPSVQIYSVLLTRAVGNYIQYKKGCAKNSGRIRNKKHCSMTNNSSTAQIEDIFLLGLINGRNSFYSKPSLNYVL